MKKTVEFLKNKGVVEDLQKMFDEIKPPHGTPEEIILDAIGSKIDFECDKSDDFEDGFFTAVLEDVCQHIRKELNIEFVEESELLSRLLPKEVVEMIEKLEKSGANVHVHVVGVCGEKKGQGEK